MEGKKTYVFSAIIMIAIIIFTAAPVIRDGMIEGRVVKLFDGATLNGTAVGTGTAFRVEDNIGYMSIFYDVNQGTSTPHYKINLYTSPDNSTWVTTGTLLTASSDETSVDVKHVAASIPVTNWARIDMEGVAPNATNTTYSIWMVTQ